MRFPAQRLAIMAQSLSGARCVVASLLGRRWCGECAPVSSQDVCGLRFVANWRLRVCLGLAVHSVHVLPLCVVLVEKRVLVQKLRVVFDSRGVRNKGKRVCALGYLTYFYIHDYSTVFGQDARLSVARIAFYVAVVGGSAPTSTSLRKQQFFHHLYMDFRMVNSIVANYNTYTTLVTLVLYRSVIAPIAHCGVIRQRTIPHS